MPTELVFSASSSLAQLAGQYPTTDFSPLFHISVHSCAFPEIKEDWGLTTYLPKSTDLHICALHFSGATATRQTLQFSTAIYNSGIGVSNRQKNFG